MAHITKETSKRKGVRWRLRWIAPDGTRLSDTFNTKKEAEAKRVALEAGQAGGENISVTELCAEFMTHMNVLMQRGVRERSTIEQYRQHIDHLKADEIAAKKLHDLKTPDVQKALDRLLAKGMSPETTKKVRGSLRRIAKWGQQRGYILIDPVSATEIAVQERLDEDDDAENNVVIPSKQELARLLAAADARKEHDKGYAAALIRTLLFCGLRISEARGLTRDKVVITGPSPHIMVHRKLDKWNDLGRTKTVKSRRKITLGAETAQALRVWLVAAPKGERGLVFPNGLGNPEHASNIWNRLWCPLLAEAGMADSVPRNRKSRYTGKMRTVQLWKPHYGFHALRHAYASINIENNVQPKKLSALMGHSSIKTTMDRYGHLWVDEALDSSIAAAGESLIKSAQR